MMRIAIKSLMRRRAKHTMRGVAAVELAVVMIPLVLLVFGVAEFGRALYQYNTLVKAVRDAARTLSLHSPSDASYPAEAARCLATYGFEPCAGTASPPLAYGLITNMVVICDRVSAPNGTENEDCPDAPYENVNTGSGTINLVQVRIKDYPFTWVLPTAFSATTITFGDIRATMRQ